VNFTSHLKNPDWKERNLTRYSYRRGRANPVSYNSISSFCTPALSLQPRIERKPPKWRSDHEIILRSIELFSISL